MNRFFATVAAMAIASASPAAAATLITNGSGQLTGASGVIVNSVSYDVLFVDNRCTVIFSGCDSASDFDFQNSTDAETAAQALLDQVFIGQFDTDYTLTFGCPGIVDFVHYCSAIIPFQPQTFGFFSAFAAIAQNTNDLADFSGVASFDPVDDPSAGSDGPYRVFARFTLSATGAAVPEPSTWLMMLLGFSAVGASLRYRRRSKLLQLA